MNPDQVGRSYDEIADRWNDERFPRDNGIEPHLRALAFVTRRRRALDVGCGSNGRFIDLLMRHGFEVEGVDVSKRMVDLARQRHPTVPIHLADICEWQLPGQFDLITAWDSIWHVPLAEHRQVITKLLTHLSSGGVCIFTAGGVDEASEKIDSAMGPQMYHSSIGVSEILRVITHAGCVCRHLEYDQWPELHVYFIVQKPRQAGGVRELAAEP